MMADTPRLITRILWKARPPAMPLDELALPVPRIVVCHTASESFNSTPECIKITRYIQNFHMDSRKSSDIAYNFLIGGDGCVYEGRGWNWEGAHSKGHNNRTIAVAFIGTYIQEEPNSMMVEAFKKLIRLGLKMGKISQDYKINGHCQLMPTASPGHALLKIIQKLPQFDSSLPINKGVYFLEN